MILKTKKTVYTRVPFEPRVNAGLYVLAVKRIVSLPIMNVILRSILLL